MLLLILVSMLISSTCMGFDHEDLDHLTMHVGASYILQTTGYGIASRSDKLSKEQAEILSLGFTLAIGLGYKLYEGASGQDTARAMGENILGAGLAIGTHYTFEW